MPRRDDPLSIRLPLNLTHPEIAEEAFGWDPTLVTYGSGKRLMWKCPTCGGAWITTVNTRTSGSGCPYCSNQKVLIGFNDLVTTHPDVASEADGWDPRTVVAGAHAKKAWKCEQGHTWNAVVHTRAHGHGCPYCCGKLPIPGETDLATVNPDLAAQAEGWDPSTVTAFSGLKRRWKCEAGHTWSATVANRAYGNGCPHCSKWHQGGAS